MEYKFKGTKGEWHMVEYAGFMNIQDAPHYGEKNLLDADNVGLEVARHNGVLAAAAPDLLEACIRLERAIRVIKSEYNLDFINEDTRTSLYSGLHVAEKAIHRALNLTSKP